MADTGITENTNLIANEDREVEREGCGEKYTSCRWVIAYLCCAARLSQSSLRQIMGMAVVCMTLPEIDRGGGTPQMTSQSPGATQMTSQSPDNVTTMPSGSQNSSEFTWSSEFEGLILASFNFGFLATPILGGYVAGKFGGKRVVGTALIMGSVITIATPSAARYSDYLLVILRVAAGLFMGTVDPATQALWSKWAPKDEKASLTSCAYSGVSIAGMVTFFIAGYLCDVSLDNGWPFIFYLFGGYTMLCAIPWLLFVSDSPALHPRITDKEVKIITREHTHAQTDTQKPSTPWRGLFTSAPFWAIIIAHVSYSWVTSWVMAYLPKYMKQVLKFDIAEDGLLSSLPFAGRFVSGLLSGAISDFILRRNLLSTVKTRKMFQLIGCLGCAACTIPIGFLDQQKRTLAVVLLVLGLSFQNCTSVAFRINHLDIAPRFAGIMMGITLTCAMLASLSAPLITSALIKNGTRQEWQIVFFIVGGLNIVGAFVFLVFGEAHEQDWATVAVSHMVAVGYENN